METDLWELYINSRIIEFATVSQKIKTFAYAKT